MKYAITFAIAMFASQLIASSIDLTSVQAASAKHHAQIVEAAK